MRIFFKELKCYGRINAMASLTVQRSSIMMSASLGSVFLSKFSYGSCVTFAYLPGLEGGLPKMEAFGDTLGHAGRF